MRYILSLLLLVPSVVVGDTKPIRIGWIGPMSGANSKYAAYEAAQLAEEEINSSGGISGRPLELVYQDARGESRAAVAAAQHIIDAEKLDILIGGHSTPESLPIAPMVERAGKLMLAAITSTPKLSQYGDGVFRITAVSVQGIDVMVPYITSTLGVKRAAVVYEETDYAIPLAERFRDSFAKVGDVVAYESYLKGESDFRSILSRVKAGHPEFIYFAIQSPDASVLLLKQLSELRIQMLIGGNELMGSAVTAFPEQSGLFEGLYFSSPEFDLSKEPTKGFVDRYKRRFRTEGLPMGIWTAEAYDAVKLMAEVVGRCGSDLNAIKSCLYEVRNYPGASGLITIDRNGDGLRNYQLQQIRQGQAVVVQ